MLSIYICGIKEKAVCNITSSKSLMDLYTFKNFPDMAPLKVSDHRFETIALKLYLKSQVHFITTIINNINDNNK